MQLTLIRTRGFAEGQVREKLFQENFIQLAAKSENITVLDNPVEKSTTLNERHHETH